MPGISATPYEDNFRYFNVVIAGPAASPYEGESARVRVYRIATEPEKACANVHVQNAPMLSVVQRTSLTIDTGDC